MEKFSYVLLLITVLLTGCEKDEETTVKILNYIVSGDTINTKFTRLSFSLDNYTISDSVPSSSHYGSSYSKTIPINIDYDPTPDIRYGYGSVINSDFLVLKFFVIGNNYGNDKNIEFAVNDSDYYGGSIDTINPQRIKLIHTFSKLDTINEQFRWVQDKEVSEFYHVSYYSNLKKYYNNYSGVDLLFNINAQNKFMGIRKKENNEYIYGWIEFSITNNDKVDIKGCAFAY